MLHYYLPDGPALRDADRRADRRSACGTGATASTRLEATTPEKDLKPLIDSLPVGRRVVLVEPITWTLNRWRAPWTALVRHPLEGVVAVPVQRPAAAGHGDPADELHAAAAESGAGDGDGEDALAGSVSTKRAPRSSESRELERAAHPLGELARRSPGRGRSRSRTLVALPRWKRSKIVLALVLGDARAAVGDSHGDRGRRRGGADLDRLAGAARSAARCRSGCARPARTAAGSAVRPARAGGSRRRARRRGRRRAARTRPRRRARSRPARRARCAAATAASRRERSSSSVASTDSRRSSPRALRDLLLGVASRSPPVAQVLVEQLHRALQHRQRRAQLVRGGRDERAPRRLLAAQLLLHAAERAGEVADLVAAAVDRRRAPPGPPR